MALFGAPVALEDGAAPPSKPRSGSSGRSAAQPRDRGPPGPAIRMRIGLNTGAVVVGRIGDDCGWTTRRWATPRTSRPGCSRRPARQRAGQRIDAARDRRVLREVDLGELEVKGHAPVHALEVLRPRARRSRLDAAVERGLTPLVGRARELDILRERFREARPGAARSCSWPARPASGSRAAPRVTARAWPRPARTRPGSRGGASRSARRSRCCRWSTRSANFGIEELDGEPEIIAKIEHGMADRRAGRADPVSSATCWPSIRAIPKVAAIDAAARRARILEAVRALALAVRRAAGGPGVRGSALDGREQRGVPRRAHGHGGERADLLVPPTGRLRAAVRRAAASTPRSPARLSDDDALAMAGCVLGNVDFPRELHEALTAKAEGVPLYVEEVAKTLLDLGVLRRENGGYGWCAARGGRHPRHDPGHHHGAARPPGRGRQAHRPARLGDRPPIPQAAARADRRARRTSSTACSPSSRGSRSSTSGAAARAGLHVQARGHPGRRLPEPAGAAPQGAAPRRRPASRSCTPTGWPTTTRSWPITSPRARSGRRPSSTWSGRGTRPGIRTRTKPPSATTRARSTSRRA